MHLVYERMNDVFEKWIIHGLPFPAAFHHFTGLEHGPAHDHPWRFRSTVLSGGYIERVYQMDGSFQDIERNVGDTFENGSDHIHQIIAFPQGECWTIILPGPHEQESGFYQFRDGTTFYRPWHRAEFERLA